MTIAPNHQDTNDLFSQIIIKFDEQIQQQLDDDKPTKVVYATYQKMLKVAPNNKRTKRLATKITNLLLIKAEEQIAKQFYSTPKNNNAVSTFKAILAITPDNTKANKGLKKIAKRYYRLALRKYDAGYYETSMTWLKKGLKIIHDDPKLNELKQKVIEQLK